MIKPYILYIREQGFSAYILRRSPVVIIVIRIQTPQQVYTSSVCYSRWELKKAKSDNYFKQYIFDDIDRAIGELRQAVIQGTVR